MRTPQLSFQPGDIFACWGTDSVSRLISVATSSLRGPIRYAPSHVAMACPWQRDHPASCHWYESTTLTGRHCLSALRQVSGAQVHEVRDRIADYVARGGCVRVFRLTPIDALDPEDVCHLRAMLGEFLGSGADSPIGYDSAGAVLSGTRVMKRLTIWHNNLDKLFCSELIAAVLQRLCRMNRRDPAWFNPGRLLRELMRQGSYYHADTFRHGDRRLKA